MSELTEEEIFALNDLMAASKRLDSAVHEKGGFRDLRVLHTVVDAKTMIEACIEEIKRQGESE